MEGQPTEVPLKVCPHCSVASRTDAETCPSCGKPYVRRGPRLRWSWWLAIPIVAAAFAIGYFGISQLFDDDGSEAGVITREEGESTASDLTRPEVEEQLGEPVLVESRRGRTASCLSPDGDPVEADEVLIYSVSDEGDTLWQFCFMGEKQVSSSSVPPG